MNKKSVVVFSFQNVFVHLYFIVIMSPFLIVSLILIIQTNGRFLVPAPESLNML